jgi:hypothetical protein
LALNAINLLPKFLPSELGLNPWGEQPKLPSRPIWQQAVASLAGNTLTQESVINSRNCRGNR